MTDRLPMTASVALDALEAAPHLADLESRAPKFVLIDHSICGVGGHYYEYAQHVLQAAKQAGYEPILVTNRRFEADEAMGLRAHALYECGFWSNLARPRWLKWLAAGKRAATASYLRCRTRLMYSELGILWSMRRQPGAYFRLPKSTRRSWPAVLALIAIACVTKLIVALAAAVIETVPCRGYVTRVSTAWRRLFLTLWAPARNALKDGGWLWRWLADYYKRAKFKKATLELSQIESLARGDVVLLPTASEIELAAVAAALRACEPLQQAKWHLIFRRNIFPGRKTVEPVESAELARMQNVFQRFADLHSSGVLAFHTDTEELTDQYHAITGRAFRTLPIPHTRPATEVPVTGPLSLVYLGDARTEKGYQHLPRIVGDLWRDYVRPGRVTFAIQSNYNIPLGEPAAIVARSLLREYESPSVRLLENPLNSEEYWRVLLSSGISLLPYDQDNYYARSSGILAESLAAGVPVLVPAGTWLSRQFIGDVYAYRRSLIERFGEIHSIGAPALKPRHADVAKRTSDAGNNWLIGGGDRWTDCYFDGPPEANHVIVSLSLARSSMRDLLELCLQQFRDRKLVEKRIVLVERDAGEQPSVALIPLADNAQRFRLILRNSASDDPIAISDLKLTFVRLPGPALSVPTSSVGQVYRSVDDIATALQEMIEHREHYRATARAFSRKWRSWHNAANLIHYIKTPSGLDSHWGRATNVADERSAA